MTTFAFTEPVWLWLLLLAPLFWWVARRYGGALSPFRAWLALSLRLLTLAALTLALAGFTLMQTHDQLAVLFLVDGSDSIPPAARAEALKFATEALPAARNGDRAGILVFGRDAMVETAPTDKLEFPEKLDTVVDPTASDLAGALRVAAGVFPADAKKRVVLLSDGLQTRGNYEEEGVAAAAQQIQLDYVPLSKREGAEVLVERVVTPARVAQDEAFDVTVIVRPFDDGTATVRLFRDGALVDERPVKLEAGKLKPIVFAQKLHTGGFFSYEAVIEPSADTIPQNNSAIGYTRVSGTPRVLIATQAKQGGRHLKGALEAGGFEVAVTGPEGLGTQLAEMAGYDAIFLENVLGTDLSRAQMETLRSFVRDFGGGLVAVGGDQSYGVGGWDDTPLEEILPVDMTMKDTEEHPAVNLEIVIDKSGSMSGTDSSGVSKIQMAKEAAIAAVELLSPRDSVGVIAFDGASQIMAPPTKLGGGNKANLVDRIGSIGGGGGTDFFPALEDGLRESQGSGASVKHVILVSDGQSSPGDIAGLTARYRAAKVTLSTIAIGADADQHTMEDIAKRGGGRYYFSPDAESIPRVFTRETILIAKNYLIEEPFVPQLTNSGGMVRGFEGIAVPQLVGYVGTTKKDQATQWMKTHKGDPLLASWRVGLGKSIAWTSDAEPRWSKNWTSWDGYAKFWSQVARFSLGAREGSGLSATASIDGEGVMRIEAEALDSGGDFANFRSVFAEVVGPDRKRTEVQLRQTGPGKYTAVTKAEKVGAYLVTVAMAGAEAGAEVSARAVAGASVSYSPEYRISAGDGGLLARVAARSGGTALKAPALAFRAPEVPARVPKEVTWHLLWLAACLFLLDVAIRRVMIGRDSVDRVLASVKGVFRPAPAGAPSHVAGLAAAKRGAALQPPPARPPVPGTSSGVPSRPRPPVPGTSAGSGVPNPGAPPAAGAAPIPERPVIRPSAPPRTNPDSPPPAGPAPGAGGNLAGSLLDRVKKNQKK